MNILDLLDGPAGEAIVGQLSNQMGMDRSKTQSAVTTALPALLAGLSKQTQSKQQAESLNKALERDHDGSILNDLTSAIGNRNVINDGEKILGHVLGNKKPAMEKAMSQQLGIDAGQAAMVMSQLAPIVMGYMGKQKKEQNLDIGGLAGMLMQQKEQVQKKAPQESSLLTSLLDQDGDGDITKEVTNIGMKMLGNFFKK